jgi:hypothetical protein
VEFGIHDYEASPAGGWAVMSAADFTTHRAAFIASYNKLSGIKVLKLFQSGNCCFAVKGGEKLTISGTPYSYQFPAAISGGIRCNPSGGYTENAYQFYRTAKLSNSASFGSKPACATSHNPGVFMKVEAPTPKVAVQFGIYDFSLTPAGGWNVMDGSHLVKYKKELISHYNTNKGIAIIKTFTSGNCCIAVKGGNKLVISETPYGFIFPADDKGTVKCNPKGGYTGKLQFYKAPTLKETQTFTVKAGCSVSHNPAIFYRAIQAVVKQEFGIFDFAAVPSGGWEVASSAALEKHKLDFISIVYRTYLKDEDMRSGSAVVPVPPVFKVRWLGGKQVHWSGRIRRAEE